MRSADAARALRGARVLHLNATPYGGGVSELLRSVVPLLNDQGLVADWRIISGDEPFFQVTKAIHNGLQGADVELSDADKARYLATSRANAAGFDADYDFIFVHDPQPAALLGFTRQGAARAGSGGRTSTPRNANPGVWSFLRPFLAEYDAVDLHDGRVRPRRSADAVAADHPAGDRPAESEEPGAARGHRAPGAGVDRRAHRPAAGHAGVALRSLEGSAGRHRGLPAGAGGGARAAAGAGGLDGDRTIPRAGTCTAPSATRSRGDKRVHVFTNLVGVGNIEVNAFQALSKVVIQKSLREGFGLVVAEALWKGTPVVAGRAGGIPLQMADGTGGMLVDSVEECARAMVDAAARRAPRPGAGGERPRAGAAALPDSAAGARRAVVDAAAGDGRDGRAARSNGCRSAIRSAAWRSRPPTETTAARRASRCASAPRQCRDKFAAAPDRYLHRGAPRTASPAIGEGAGAT